MKASLFSVAAAVALLSGCIGCSDKSNDASRTPPPCTASWCPQVQQACDAWLAQCPGLAELVDSATAASPTACTDALGALVAASAPDAGPEAAQALLDCMRKAKSCVEATACRDSLIAPPSEGAPDSAGVDLGAFTDAPPIPPGTVLLPGDDPACVQCALSNCATESAYCFVNSQGTPACWNDPDAYPPIVDCCVDYRQCIDGCLASDPDAGATFSLCATQCDADYPKGKAQFDIYRTCMASKCATCGAGDAGH